MTKLPFFKFFSKDWLSGNIQAHDMETQGVFINICARAWSEGGKIEANHDRLSRLLRVNKQILASALQLLVDDGLLVLLDGCYSSKFILLQLEELSTLSKKRAVAGRKGGNAKQLARRSNCQALATFCSSIKDTDTDTDTEPDNNTPPPRKPPSVGLQLSKLLLDKTAKAIDRKLTSTPASGTKYINKLIKLGNSEQSIKDAIEWLCGKNLTSGFTIDVWSGSALFGKWDRIQALMKRVDTPRINPYEKPANEKRGADGIEWKVGKKL
jgi:hypothetical protein